MKTEREAERAINAYGDSVRRICFIHLKNHADVEDVFQEVFLKYILYEHPFESDVHERSWLLRVAINQCKDLLKSFFRKKVASLEDADIAAFPIQEKDLELLDAVLRLPDRYRDVIYLYYYEGYSAVEIAHILKKRENTVYTWLSRAKAELRERLEGESYGK